MKTNRFLKLGLIASIASNAACLPSLGKPGPLFKSAGNSTASSATSVPAPQKKLVEKESDDYKQQVRERFIKKDYTWIDQEASRVRINKERLPGGYWKLRTLYSAIERPKAGDNASDGEWQDFMAELTNWTKQQPKSVTAKVALATAWKEYAWKVRGGGYSDSVSPAAWEAFEKRLANAAQILSEAMALEEKCPHMYVTAIWIATGQQWNDDVREKVFADGIKLEPTYYYLYQARASYLLPQWGGAKGEWERFAEESALKVGGHEGDIIFFAIYSQMLNVQGMTFMNTHVKEVPRLLAGFRSIEKLYGAAPHRLNEACFFASFGNDPKTKAELFKRVGDDYDESVWRSKRNFEIFREGALVSANQPQTRK